jgi:type II secretory pathway pseudopilin PulG
MISRLRERLRDDADAGITLVEVIVAMMIFALVSTGFVYTMLSVLSLTRDSRAREVAANLAAAEIDLARDSADLFKLLDDEREYELNGDTFRVVRTTRWVSDPSQDFSCGGINGAGGQLRYKRVSVRVTWEGMRAGTEPVGSDTVINPDARINDPDLGTIIVSVLNAAGTGSPGITVSTTPSAGAVVNATDAQGCTYVLKVKPGTYTVSLAKSGYVDSTQKTNPSQSINVVKAGTATVGFQYDQEAKYTATLASNAPAGVTLPTDVRTTFTNSYGSFPMDSKGGPKQTFALHPFASGYQAYAGTCVAGDPSEWPEELVGTQPFRGQLQPAAAALPGGAASISVPMGYVSVTGIPSGTLRAVSAAPVTTGPTAPPVCAAEETISFGEVSGARTLALPYGTWKLVSVSGGKTTAIPASAIKPLAPAIPERTQVAPDGRITLDPRVAVTP